MITKQKNIIKNNRRNRTNSRREGNTTKSNNSTRRLQWTPWVPRKPRREHEWQTNKQKKKKKKKREQKSAIYIDLIMVYQCGYEKFEEMEVDEKREIYDLSDHCMVRLSLKIKKN